MIPIDMNKFYRAYKTLVINEENDQQIEKINRQIEGIDIAENTLKTHSYRSHVIINEEGVEACDILAAKQQDSRQDRVTVCDQTIYRPEMFMCNASGKQDNLSAAKLELEKAKIRLEAKLAEIDSYRANVLGAAKTRLQQIRREQIALGQNLIVQAEGQFNIALDNARNDAGDASTAVGGAESAGHTVYNMMKNYKFTVPNDCCPIVAFYPLIGRDPSSISSNQPQYTLPPAFSPRVATWLNENSEE